MKTWCSKVNIRAQIISKQNIMRMPRPWTAIGRNVGAHKLLVVFPRLPYVVAEQQNCDQVLFISISGEDPIQIQHRHFKVPS